MGASLSINRKAGICVTLDAFGTLYRPRKPIATQYLEVARRCGLDLNVKSLEVQSSFLRAFKDQYAKHPNYGKASGMKAEEWWDSIVRQTFLPHLGSRELPASLSPMLYRHFSGKDAYELYPDVRPFLKSMRALQERYSDATGPLVAVGVLSNSDARVQPILEGLEIRCSPVVSPNHLLTDRRFWDRTTTPITYNPDDEINFVMTSYAIGHEKPDRRIFQNANQMANCLRIFRYLEDVYPSRPVRLRNYSMEKTKQQALSIMNFVELVKPGLPTMHVGDDFEKDYEGAKASGWEALQLCRGINEADKQSHQISSLEELAVIVQTMARLNFEDGKE